MQHAYFLTILPAGCDHREKLQAFKRFAMYMAKGLQVGYKQGYKFHSGLAYRPRFSWSATPCL
eukprot:1158437-Pelagomonas_calceolata.AAC.4